jgi:MFS transporter, DHA2 family, multidrug resistance protein
VVFSVGLAPVYALTTEIIIDSVAPERAGTASAIAETGAELGGALGVAVLGSLGVAVYRHLMSHASLPPRAASEAGGTIGSASALARTLPAASGHSLMTAAAHAFTQAFAVMSAVSAAIIAVVAVVAFRRLHSTPDQPAVTTRRRRARPRPRGNPGRARREIGPGLR